MGDGISEGFLVRGGGGGRHHGVDRHDLAHRLPRIRSEVKWRRLDTLARVTALTEQDVKDYLIEVDARGSANNGKLWGLISRNPVADAGENDPKTEC